MSSSVPSQGMESKSLSSHSLSSVTTENEDNIHIGTSASGSARILANAGANGDTKESSSSSSLQDIQVPTPGLWRYSKTRQLTFWIKKSLRDVITPDLNVVYEEQANNDNYTIDGNGDNDDNDNDSHNGNGMHSSISTGDGANDDKNNYNNHDVNDNNKNKKSKKNDERNTINNEYEYEYQGEQGDTSNNNSEIDSDSQADHEYKYTYPLCDNIDDAMCALHTLIPDGDFDISIPTHLHVSSVVSTMSSSTTATAPTATNHHNHNLNHHNYNRHHHYQQQLHRYDWILDGDPINDHDNDNEGANNERKLLQMKNSKKQRTKLGVEELDSALESMELEFTNTPSKSSSAEGEGEMVMEMEMEMEMDMDMETLDQSSLCSRNMDKSLLLINNEKLILTPKAHNHTPNNGNNNENQRQYDTKEIGDFECILDYLPSSTTGTPKTYSRCSNSNDILIMDDDYMNMSTSMSNNILDHLPFEDPSTPEGKFFRYLKMERERECLREKSLLCDSGHGIQIQGNEHEVTDSSPRTSSLSIPIPLTSSRIEDLLPSGYYSSDFDPVLDMLNSLSWEKEWWDDDDDDNGNDSSNDDGCKDYKNNIGDDDEDFPIMQMDHFLTEKLSSLDEVSQETTNQLLFEINQKNEEIEERMNLVRGIDCDVTNALSHAKEATLYLERARGRDRIRSGGGRDGITGGLQIIEEANHRDKLRSVDYILKLCSDLFDMEHSILTMRDRLDSKILLSRSDYMETLIKMSERFKKRVLHEEQCLRIDSLCQLRERALRIMGSICKRLEDGLLSFISHKCTSFHLSATKKWNNEASREYYSLLKARFQLHEFHLSEVKENSDGDKVDATKLPNIAISWSHCIMKALCFEAERCLARALLDPTSFDDNAVFESCGEFDENLIEIRMKLNQLQAYDKDAASLRSITKNLLSIRFQFEKRNDLLPWIFHKVCSLFADLMNTYCLLIQCHKSFMEDDNSLIHGVAILGKDDLWTHCKSLLVILVKSFLDLNQTNDDGSLKWAQELENNHDILKLSDQISRLAREFTGNDNVDYDLREVLNLMFEKYIRRIHVEAMTEVGTMMASDTWELVPIPMENSNDEGLSTTEKLKSSIQSFLLNIQKSESAASLTTSQIRPWHNAIEASLHDSLFDYFSTVGNPFILKRIVDDRNIPNCRSTKRPPQAQHESSFSCDLCEKISQLICCNDMQSMIGTHTVLNGISRWTVRLLTIRKKLPLVSDQITGIIRNIYDLYLLTVFRLCIGNVVSEDIVLGNTERSDSIFNERFPIDLPPSTSQSRKIHSMQSRSQPFSRRRQSSTDSHSQSTPFKNVPVSRYCDADIYSPLKIEEDIVSRSRVFIRRAQASLTGMVDLNQIEGWKLSSSTNDLASDVTDVDIAVYLQKRIIASFSCLVVANILDIAFHTSELSLNLDTMMKRNAPLVQYLNQMMNAIQHIYLLCLRMSTIRAIKGRDVVTKVISVGGGWAESKLNAHCNDYVDHLVETCLSLLNHLSASPLKHQPSIIYETWNSIVESGFLALLEGFAKVYDCSTEGRALMSIDLASFSTALPSSKPKRGMQYVDMYIKVFYFPQEDTLNWINENRDEYHLHHLMTLVSFGAHNQLSPKAISKLTQLRERVKKMHT